MTSADHPTIERLMAHAAFARALARGLLHDEHAAEDVLQDAYVAALERPPESNPRAWFAVVAKRMSFRTMRGARRRAAREAAREVAEAPASPAELAERRDSLRAVFEAVLALPEPFQTAVLLRFYEGLEPAQIAVRLGVPAATVRTRLFRALGMLRERLDDEHDGDRPAWCAALLPLAAAARKHAVPATTAAATLGGLLVAKKIAAAAAALLLVAVGAWLVVDRTAGTLPTSRADASTETASPRRGERRAPAPREEDAAAETNAAAPAAAPAEPPRETGPARIVGRAIDERTGGGASGAEIFVLSNDASREDFARAKPRARADADGRFVCDDLAPGPHHVAARAAGLLDAHAHDVAAVESGGREAKLVLAAPQRIVGRVVAPPGVSLEGAKAYCTIPNDRAAKWNWWTNVDAASPVGADGTFVLEGLPAREFDVWAEVERDKRRWSGGERAVPAAGPAVVVTIESADTPTNRYRLRVLDPEGRPVASGSARRFILQWSGASQCGDKPIRDGVVEEDLPEFVECVWFEPFEYVDADGAKVRAAPIAVRLAFPDDLEQTTRLEPPVALAGRVRDAGGRGVAGVRVVARPAAKRMNEWLRERYPHGEATSDAEGAFRVEGLAPIDYALSLDVPPQFVPAREIPARPGVAAEIALVAALRPVVTVLDEAGAPVADAGIELSDGEAGVASAKTGADGRARLDRVPPGRAFRLVVEKNDDAFAELAVHDWAPADVEVRLPPGLVVRGTVVGRDGAPVPGAEVVLRGRNGRRDDSEETNDRGAFLFERVAPGDVRLAVSVSGDTPGEDAPSFAAKAGDRALVLAVDPGLVLRARIENWGDRDASLMVGEPEFVEDGAPRAVHSGRHDGDRLSFTGLPPGRTGTIVFGPLEGGFTVARRDVKTDAGGVTVTLVRGKTLEGRFVFPPGVSPHAGEPDVWADVNGVAFRGTAQRSGRWQILGVPDGTWPVRAKLTLGARTFAAEGVATPGAAGELGLR